MTCPVTGSRGRGLHAALQQRQPFGLPGAFRQVRGERQHLQVSRRAVQGKPLGPPTPPTLRPQRFSHPALKLLPQGGAGFERTAVDSTRKALAFMHVCDSDVFMEGV